MADRRLVTIRAGGRGSGWAVGTRGVLTARHVVRPVLDGQVSRCLASPAPAPRAQAFPCTVIWDDPDRDLALLAVGPAVEADWTAMTGTAPTRLAEPGLRPVAAEAIGYPDATLTGDHPHPEQVPGSLIPTGGATSGRLPFDVESSVPGRAQLWRDMPGAAVRDRAGGRLLGVVIKTDEIRRLRRLYVAVPPDPGGNPRFAEALTAVGADPVLEAADAPVVRNLLQDWGPRGRPRLTGEVSDLGHFGVRTSRTDTGTRNGPSSRYAARELDEQLAAALDRRVSGHDTRILLLTGDAMTGRSLAGAHALQSHPVLSGRPLLIPKHDADLRMVSDLARPGGAVLWLDDLHRYTGLSTDDALYLREEPGLVCVATLRSDLLTSLYSSPAERPGWAAVADNGNLVERITLPGTRSPEAARTSAAPVPQHGRLGPLGLGRTLAAEGDLAGARRTYRAVIRTRAADLRPEAKAALGLLLIHDGQLSKGLRALRHADHLGFLGSGQIGEFLAGELRSASDPTARRRHRAAAAHSPNTDVLIWLAALTAAEGDISGAHVLLTRAQDEGAGRAAGYLALTGDAGPQAADPQTLAVIRAAAQDGSGEARCFLGLQEWLSGRPGRARDWWAQADRTGDVAGRLLLR